MKLTKEDYMRLPKERLAELLVERDNESEEIPPITFPTIPVKRSDIPCDGTHCTNPQMDCINCPRRYYSGSAPFAATFNTASAENNDKVEVKQ